MPDKPDEKPEPKSEAAPKPPRKADLPLIVFDALERIGHATELELLEAIDPFPADFDADKLRVILAAAPPGIESATVSHAPGMSRTEWTTAKYRGRVLGS